MLGTDSADRYLSGLAERLAADGCSVTHEEHGLVGHKAQMRALTRTHFFVVAGKADAADQANVTSFVEAAVQLAVGRKGRWLGMQSAIVVLPVLVAGTADERATALSERPYRLKLGGFAVMAQLAIVELSTGKVLTFRGTRLWGYAYNSLIKQKYRRYLPEQAAS